MLITMTSSSYVYMSWENEDEIVAEEDTVAVNNSETAEQRRTRSEAQKERIVGTVKKQICSGLCER